GGVADRGQHTVWAIPEGGDAALAGSGVSVTHEQLRRVCGTELRADRAEGLGGERRAGRCGETTVGPDSEAVDQRGVVAGADQAVSDAVEQDVANRGALGDSNHR